MKYRFLPTRWSVFWGSFILILSWIPIAYAIRLAFSTSTISAIPEGITFGNFGRVLDDYALMTALVRSVIVAFMSAIISTVLGTFSAIFQELRRGRKLFILYAVFLFPLVTPDALLGLAVGHGAAELSIETGGVLIVIAHSIFGVALVYFIVRAAMDQTLSTLAESASCLGINPFYTATKVLAPHLMRPIIAGFIVAFVVSLDDFAVTYFLAVSGNQTFPVVLFSRLSKGLRPEHFAAALMLFVMNLGILFALLKRYGLRVFDIEGGE